jgi:hypothetical protein
VTGSAATVAAVSNSVICCSALIRGIRRRRGDRHQSGKFLLADGDDRDSVAGVTALESLPPILPPRMR